MSVLLKTTTKIVILLPVLIVCCYYTISQSVKILQNYYQNPYTTSVQFISQGKVRFPKIRVCPSNWVDRQKQRQLNISDEFLEYLLEFLIDNLIVRRHYSTSDSVKLFKKFQHFQKQNPQHEYPFGIINFLRERCEVLLDKCYWKGQFFNCCNSSSVERVNTNIGPCFLIRTDYFADQFQHLAGPVDGLQFSIREHSSKERRPRHRFNKLPLNSGIVSVMDGFRPWTIQPQLIASKASTFIGLNFVESVRIHDCSDQFAVEPTFPGKRARAACLYGCFVREIYRTCECYPTSIQPIVIPNNAKMCDPWDYSTCFRSHVYPNMSYIISFCDKKIKQKCPDNCVSRSYNPSTASAPLPSEHTSVFEENENATYQLSNVLIYFTTTGKTVIQEVKTQTFYTILSNVGGLVGLWLGLSIFGLASLFTQSILVPVAQRAFEYSTKKTKMKFGREMKIIRTISK